MQRWACRCKGRGALVGEGPPSGAIGGGVWGLPGLGLPRDGEVRGVWLEGEEGGKLWDLPM